MSLRVYLRLCMNLNDLMWFEDAGHAHYVSLLCSTHFIVRVPVGILPNDWTFNKEM